MKDKLTAVVAEMESFAKGMHVGGDDRRAQFIDGWASRLSAIAAEGAGVAEVWVKVPRAWTDNDDDLSVHTAPPPYNHSTHQRYKVPVNGAPPPQERECNFCGRDLADGPDCPHCLAEMRDAWKSRAESAEQELERVRESLSSVLGACGLAGGTQAHLAKIAVQEIKQLHNDCSDCDPAATVRALEDTIARQMATLAEGAKSRLAVERECADKLARTRTERDAAIARADTEVDEAAEDIRQLGDECDAAIKAKDEAEENYQYMVDHAADNKLNGYRELGARAATAENECDSLRDRVRELEGENTDLRARYLAACKRHNAARYGWSDSPMDAEVRAMAARLDSPEMPECKPPLERARLEPAQHVRVSILLDYVGVLEKRLSALEATAAEDRARRDRARTLQKSRGTNTASFSIMPVLEALLGTDSQEDSDD